MGLKSARSGSGIAGKFMITTCLRAVPASTFTPNSLPNLALWLDPSYGVYTDGAAAGDGDPVSMWIARTGQVFSQPTYANRPIWRANSGKPYVSFNGVNQYIYNTSFLPSPPLSIIAGIIPANTAGSGEYLGIGTNNSAIGSRIGLYLSGGNLITEFSNSGRAGSITLANGTIYASSDVFSSTDIATGVSQWINGASDTLSAGSGTIAITGGSFTLGCVPQAVAVFYQGAIGNVVVCTTVLSASQRNQTETYVINALTPSGSSSSSLNFSQSSNSQYIGVI